MSEVLVGVEADIGRLPKHLRSGGPANLARAMAERIDEGRGSPSECGKVCLVALAELRDMSPPEQQKGPLDDLSARRALRLAGMSDSQT